MPFTVDDANLARLIEKALENPSIAPSIGKDELRRNRLVERLKKNREALAAAVNEAAISDIQQHDKLEADLQGVNAEIARNTPAKPWYIDGLFMPMGILGTLTWIVAIIGAVASYFFGEVPGLGWSWWVLPAIVGAIGFVVMISAIILSVGLEGRYDDRRLNIVNALKKQFATEDLSKKLNALREHVESQAVERAIVPAAIQTLNEIFGKSYKTEIKQVPEATGLTEVYYLAQEIDTVARIKLKHSLDLMSGGSIGVAGPRGAGKTTLINYCYSLPKVKVRDKGNEVERPVLPIKTSAPVEYDSRDFLLHLYATLCETILKKGVPEKELPFFLNEPELPLQTMEGLQLIFWTPTVSRWILISGIFLIAFALISAMIVGAEAKVDDKKPAAASTVLAKKQEAVGDQPVAPEGKKETAVEDPLTYPKFLRALGISLASILYAGIALLLVGLVHGYCARWKYESTVLRVKSDPPLDPTWRTDALLALARDALNDIRFQRSFTTGWTGSLKLPFGLEGGASRAVQLAQKQKSLPEVAAAFRELLRLAGERDVVIVGIDELDKLESAEKAQRFLNEIKVIFGVPNCFFLISVSENAMSSFERRGMPFRDAFDSSFDDIVYVDYLSITDSIDLLLRRVLLLPIPFIALCYCLSGGLARDLIRTCRHVLEVAQGPPAKRTLQSLCTALMAEDVKKKARALAFTLRNLVMDGEAPSLMVTLVDLQENVLSASQMVDACKLLLQEEKAAEPPPSVPQFVFAGFTPTFAEENGQADDAAETFASLKRELIVYLYFAATLMEFFHDGLPEDAFKSPDLEKKTQFHLLAGARRLFALNASLAQSMVTAFRQLHHLSIPDFLK